MRVENGTVVAFAEKPIDYLADQWGYFIFERAFFNCLSSDEGSILQGEPLEGLARDRQLRVYEHHGFWRCMDIFKDYLPLNEADARGEVRWMGAAARSS